MWEASALPPLRKGRAGVGSISYLLLLVFSVMEFSLIRYFSAKRRSFAVLAVPPVFNWGRSSS